MRIASVLRGNVEICISEDNSGRRTTIERLERLPGLAHITPNERNLVNGVFMDQYRRETLLAGGS